MKKMLVLAIAALITIAPIQQSKASDISTSVVVGVLVASYVGPLAGVAASSVLAGTEIVLHSGKEAALKAAQNDVQNFNSTGVLSASLANAVQSLKAMDSDLSDAEAMDEIVASLQ